MANFDTVLEGVLDRSCSSVFGPRERLPCMPFSSVKYGHLGLVPFSGVDHRGHVAVAIPAGTARQLCQHWHDDPAANVSDYVGELANMVLGQIKAEFAAFGVLIHSGTPVVLRGVALSVDPRPDGRMKGCWVDTACGPLQVWVDVALAEELTGETSLAADVEAGQAPGEPLLF